MGQTNDTPAERRTPPTAPRTPARRLPSPPPADEATGGDEQRARRVTNGHTRSAEPASPASARPVSRSAHPVAPQPSRVGARAARLPAPSAPISPNNEGADRILVFSTQRDTPRDVPGNDRQLPPQDAPDSPDSPDVRSVPATLPRPRPLRAPRERTENGAGMVSLGDSLRDFVSVLEERRRRRLAEGRDRVEPVALRSDLDDVCPLCHGAGYLRRDVPVGDPLFGQPLPCECKERELEERRHLEEEARLKQLDRFFSLSPFGDKTFETFHPNVRGTEAAYGLAQQYAADPIGWLVLIGPPGTGKTHLAAAVAHERLAAGSSVYFAVVPELLDHLRAAFAPTSELTYDEMFDTVRSVEMLVLDDLGAQNSTPWAADKLFQIINFRYNYRLPTVITTNHKLHAQLDERVRSRLSDISLVRVVEFKNPDHRPRNTRIVRR